MGQNEQKRCRVVGLFQGLVWNCDSLWVVQVLMLMVALSSSPNDEIDYVYQHCGNISFSFLFTTTWFKNHIQTKVAGRSQHNLYSVLHPELGFSAFLSSF